MRAISIKQPWASLIAEGHKTIETRTWSTRYRGRILIVSSKKPNDSGPAGMALCVATIVNCRKMTLADEPAAQCELYARAWSWVLIDVTPIEPFAQQGERGLYNVDCIETLDGYILRDGDDCYVRCVDPHGERNGSTKPRKAIYRSEQAIDMGWTYELPDFESDCTVEITHTWKVNPGETDGI